MNAPRISGVLRALKELPEKGWERMTTHQQWLHTLPSTNFKIFHGIVLLYLTAVFTFLMLGFVVIHSALHPDETVRVPDGVEWVYYSWLALVAAFNGLGNMQFGKKRDTYASPSPDSERAGVPASPAPTAPAVDAKAHAQSAPVAPAPAPTVAASHMVAAATAANATAANTVQPRYGPSGDVLYLHPTESSAPTREDDESG